MTEIIIKTGKQRQVVDVDSCIAEEIKDLNKHHIETWSSCCGHGALGSYIAVHKLDFKKMYDMGYQFSGVIQMLNGCSLEEPLPAFHPKTPCNGSCGKLKPSGLVTKYVKGENTTPEQLGLVLQ